MPFLSIITNLGMLSTLYLVPAIRFLSIKTGIWMLNLLMKFNIVSLSSPWLTAKNTTSLSLSSLLTSWMTGIAILQGPHQLAQKSRTTTFLPLNSERVIFFPSIVERVKSGAVSPISGSFGCLFSIFLTPAGGVNSKMESSIGGLSFQFEKRKVFSPPEEASEVGIGTTIFESRVVSPDLNQKFAVLPSWNSTSKRFSLGLVLLSIFWTLISEGLKLSEKIIASIISGVPIRLNAFTESGAWRSIYFLSFSE